jgi:cytochrome c biogenesis protein
MSTIQARADVKAPENGRFRGLSRLLAPIRNTWRTLTSMGTALVLLFLLALAAIPGARRPPRSHKATKVEQ